VIAGTRDHGTTVQSRRSDPLARRRARRRFGLIAIGFSAVLLGAGFGLSGTSIHFVATIAIGYGIGVFVAGCFLISGWEPTRRR
jgi:hypothetical protein